VDAGTNPVTFEKRERGSRLWQTVLVVVVSTAVPVVAALLLIAVRRAVTNRHPDRFVQQHMTTKNFAGHVIHTTGNGSQQLALGYVHHQVYVKIC